MQGPRLTKLFNEIEITRERLGITLKDIATQIGKPDNENQLYYWVVARTVEPKGEITLQLQEWLNNARHLHAARPRAKSMQRQNKPTQGKRK